MVEDDDTAGVGKPAGHPPRDRTTDAPVTVVVVDDHLMLADAVAGALRTHERISVVGVAGTRTEGLRLVARLRPDVCLLDQRLPDGLGTELVPALREASPRTAVLLMTGDDSVDVLHQALRAGTAGLVSKTERAASLHESVLRAADGITVLSARDVRRLLTTDDDTPAVGEDLTPRERDVLRLLARAVPTPEIASTLSISHATARNHIQSVISKLGAHTKLEAVTIALRENIVGPQ